MIKKPVGTTLFIAGTTLMALPFASTALLLLGILSVIWLKDKTLLILNTPVPKVIAK